MILCMSNSGEILPLAYRMQQEGAKVAVYLHNPKYHQGYDGLLEKTSLSKLKSTFKKADLVIYDITRPNEKYSADPNPEMVKRDAMLLTMFGLKSSERSVFGPVADVMRQDCPVVGCSRWSEEVELDRMLGYKIANQMGVKVPESHEFPDFTQGAKFLQAHMDSLWICKPQANAGFTYLESWEGELLTKMQGEWKAKCSKSWPFVLQKVLPKGSVEISTEAWFDGRRFRNHNHTIEDKYWLTGDWSIHIGSQSNIVWLKEKEGLLHKEISRIEPHLRSAGYVGPVDLNCIISKEDHKPYFLEFSPRMGYDAVYCLLSMLEGPISTYFYSGFRGQFKKGYSASQRITIPPFPYHSKELLEMAKGVDILNDPAKTSWFWAEDVKKSESGWLEVAGADAIIGVVTATGATIEEASNGVYARIKRLKVGSKIQVRTDGGKRALRDLPKLREWGHVIH